MNAPAKGAKAKPDHRKYLAVQFIGNLIGAVVSVAFLAWVVFGLFGPGSGTPIEVRAFLFLFLLCFVVIQCHNAVINTRRDFLRGRWRMGEPGGLEPDGIINPWRRIVPVALPVAAAVSLGVWFLFPLMGGDTLRLLAIEMIAFVPLFLSTTVLIAVILPRDQLSFSSAVEGAGAGPVSGFPAYFLLEHFLPWAAIQGLINVGIGVKQFTWVLEGTQPAEAITSTMVAWDFGIVFGILYFFLFLASDGQVRSDVRLGRLEPRQFGLPGLRNIGVAGVASGLIVTAVLMMAAVGLVMQALFSLAGVGALPFEAAVALKTSAAVLGTLAGCGMGIWWGRRAESTRMEIP